MAFQAIQGQKSFLTYIHHFLFSQSYMVYKLKHWCPFHHRNLNHHYLLIIHLVFILHPVLIPQVIFMIQLYYFLDLC